MAQQYWYNEENRLEKQVDSDTGITTLYTYNGEGVLVKKVQQEAGQTDIVTHYVAGLVEVETVGATSTVTKYYQFNGDRWAMRRDGTLTYLLQDHLGSTSTVLDEFGTVAGTQKYYPYGRTRVEGNLPTDKLFTGHQKEVTFTT